LSERPQGASFENFSEGWNGGSRSQRSRDFFGSFFHPGKNEHPRDRKYDNPRGILTTKVSLLDESLLEAQPVRFPT
jgi:hypothetical protein